MYRDAYQVLIWLGPDSIGDAQETFRICHVIRNTNFSFLEGQYGFVQNKILGLLELQT